MSMMELLYRTYEYAYRKEDRSLMENYLMSQTMASAPIVLWITEKGAFADATYLTDKEKQKISIPCTEIWQETQKPAALITKKPMRRICTI